jgi:hypothetical protein
MLTKHSISTFFLRAIIPALFCVAVGFCFFGMDIFSLSHSSFQFIANGIIGAIFLCLLRCTNVNNAIGIFIVLSFLDTAFVSQGVSSGYVMRDFFFALSLAFSLLIFFYLSLSNQPRLHWIDIIALGGLLAMTNVFATVFLMFIYHTSNFITAATLNGFIGLFSGIGLGFGTLVTQLFHLNPEEEHAH